MENRDYDKAYAYAHKEAGYVVDKILHAIKIDLVDQDVKDDLTYRVENALADAFAEGEYSIMSTPQRW